MTVNWRHWCRRRERRRAERVGEEWSKGSWHFWTDPTVLDDDNVESIKDLSWIKILLTARVQIGARRIHSWKNHVVIHWFLRQSTVHWSHWSKIGNLGPSGWGMQGMWNMIFWVLINLSGYSADLKFFDIVCQT